MVMAVPGGSSEVTVRATADYGSVVLMALQAGEEGRDHDDQHARGTRGNHKEQEEVSLPAQVPGELHLAVDDRAHEPGELAGEFARDERRDEPDAHEAGHVALGGGLGDVGEARGREDDLADGVQEVERGYVANPDLRETGVQLQCGHD